MATEVYGLTYADVSAELGRPDFDATTTPKATEVTTQISRVASDVNLRLTALLSATTTTIAADDNAAGWARDTIVIGAAAKAAAISFDLAQRDLAPQKYREFRDRIKDAQDSPEMFGDLYSATADAGSLGVHDPVDYADDADVTFWASDADTAF